MNRPWIPNQDERQVIKVDGAKDSIEVKKATK